MITNLLKEGDRIAGAAGFSLDEEKMHVFKAKSCYPLHWCGWI